MICGHSETQRVRNDLTMCLVCRHVQRINADPSAQTTYGESDYLAHRVRDTAWQDLQARRRWRELRPLLDDGRIGRALEIGSSTGDFLVQLASDGVEVFGVELSASASNIARMRLPDSVIRPTLEDISCFAPFDLIVLFHTLEHVSDADSLLASLSSICRKGSILAVKVPHWRSFPRFFLRQRWNGDIEEHIHFFSKDSLECILAKHGFTARNLFTSSSPLSWLSGMRRVVSRQTYAVEGKASHRSSRFTGRKKVLLDRALSISYFPFALFERWFFLGDELTLIAERR